MSCLSREVLRGCGCVYMYVGGQVVRRKAGAHDVGGARVAASAHHPPCSSMTLFHEITFESTPLGAGGGGGEHSSSGRRKAKDYTHTSVCVE